MDKQVIERAAISYSDRYSFLEDTTVVRAAFIAGAGFSLPKWIPTNAGVPQPSNTDSASGHIHCLVAINGNIELLAWNIYHVCWDDADMDDYFCDLHDVTMYIPLYLLPNPII